FFLEYAVLFANFGYANIRPFFSRRIGLTAPIRAGARLSGKLNKDWRIGVMDMQTGEDDAGVPGQNFGVFSLQRRVSKRSNIAAIFVNKQTLDYDRVADTNAIFEYNRNLGLEYNLASSNNLWTGKLLALKSFSPHLEGDDYVLAGNLAYSAKKWFFNVQLDNVGENFRAETGFVPRTGFFHPVLFGGHVFFPKSSWLLSHGPSVKLEFFTDPDLHRTDQELVLIYDFFHKNSSKLTVWVAQNYFKLARPFDPTNYAGDTLAAGTEHDWKSFGLDFFSQPQRLFTWSLSGRYGGYFAGGDRLRLGGTVGYRFQPFVAISLSANYNRLDFFEDDRLPEGLINKDFDFWLIGPRLDVTLTNKLFFTQFMQFNNQVKNVNLNLRLQWRYSPASDLFLVYTDNYFSDFSGARNRAIVFKLTYWWNL
ncbi:MAG: hydrolase, partial [Bacteroidota bacterium]